MSSQPSNSARGAMLSPDASKIEVFSGEFVDLLNPEAHTLLLEDIARGLAYTCRYGGIGIRQFYSVADHSLLVTDLLAWQGADTVALLGAMFHDAAEAYLGDLVAPLKWALRAEEASQWGPISEDLVVQYRSAYDTVTDRMEDALCRRFGLDPESLGSQPLKLADMWALRIESQVLTRSGGREWRWRGKLPNEGRRPPEVPWALGRDMEDTMVAWLDRARDLMETAAAGR